MRKSENMGFLEFVGNRPVPNNSRPSGLKVAALTAVSALLLTGCATNAGESAEIEFPTSDIRLLVPWQPGGNGDLTARTLAPLLEEDLGVNVVVENRPGANGSVAYNWLKEQDPDGYNISVMSMEINTLGPMDYGIESTDFTYLGQALSGPGAIAVPVDSPYETFEDFLADAEERPGEITYSSPGAGSGWDAAAHGLQELAGIDLTNVPFDGSAPSVAAAAAKDVDITIDAIGQQKPLVDGGELRYLATFTEERQPGLEDIPTVAESGVEFTNATFIGLIGPQDMPEDVVETLSSAIVRASQHEDFVSVIENSNYQPESKNAAEFEEFIIGESERFGRWIELAKANQ